MNITLEDIKRFRIENKDPDFQSIQDHFKITILLLKREWLALLDLAEKALKKEIFPVQICQHILLKDITCPYCQKKAPDFVTIMADDITGEFDLKLDVENMIPKRKDDDGEICPPWYPHSEI